MFPRQIQILLSHSLCATDGPSSFRESSFGAERSEVQWRDMLIFLNCVIKVILLGLGFAHLRK